MNYGNNEKKSLPSQACPQKINKKNWSLLLELTFKSSVERYTDSEKNLKDT